MVGYDKDVRNVSMWVYDPVAGSVTATGLTIPDVGYGQNLVYFPPNGKMYLMQSDGTVFEVTLNRGNFAGSTVAEVSGITGSRPATTETGWAYDAVNEIIGGGVRNGVFYAYHPPSKTWTARTMQSSSGTPIGTVAFHALDYDPVNNVFIFISDYHSGRRTWAYRYGGRRPDAELSTSNSASSR